MTTTPPSSAAQILSRTFSWGDLKAFELRRLAEEGATVLQPVASIEQHGPALPVRVDELLCTEVAHRAAARTVAAGGKVVVAPCLYVGLAEHHLPFGGTLTLSVSTYKAVLKDLCASMVRQGFTRILLLNGHGGNETALKNISQELSTELEACVAFASYWTIPRVAAGFGEILTAQRNVQHAGEGESSMMLALRPELCDAEALRTVQCPPTSKGMMDVRGVYRWQSFADYTETGCLGVPSAATADKGERMFEVAADAVADALLAPDSEWATGTRYYSSTLPGSGPGGGDSQRWLAFDKAMFPSLYRSAARL
eukprot:COSAG01_NODE_13028_length_1646_cov_3.340013_2_plen_311_part_00